MVIPRPGLFLCAALVASVALTAQSATPMNQGGLEIQPLKAEQLFALANEARASAGVKKLEWDPALAAAAVRHCMRMASEVSIAHRYDGEPDLTERAGRASAHFSLIEENIAVGSYPATIHQGWLDSPEHRVNMFNPMVDRVGIAVVASQGVIFAVADFALAVPVLTQAQVEAAFEALLRVKGVLIVNDASEARIYCASSGTYQGGDPPHLLMRWQNPDLTQLPQPLVDQLVTGRYRKASVGSCPPQDVYGAFTTYRVAVLLF